MWKYSMCLLFSCPKDNNKYQRSFIWNLKEMGYEVKQGKHLAKVMGCNMRTAQSRVRNALKIMRKEQENER